jgi:endogenous inhibitor of DNA gyrase (YacG/DUF329 family)
MIQPITCPICEKSLPATALDSPFFPFCCKRCKEIDLSRWLDGKYAVVENLTPEQLMAELIDPEEQPE